MSKAISVLLVTLLAVTVSSAYEAEQKFTLKSPDGEHVILRAKMESPLGEEAKHRWNLANCSSNATLLTIMNPAGSILGYSTKCGMMSQAEIASALQFHRTRERKLPAATIPAKTCEDAVQIKNGVMRFGCFDPSGSLVGEEKMKKFTEVPTQYDALYKSPGVVSAMQDMLAYSERCGRRDIEACSSIRLTSARLHRELEFEARLRGILK